MSPPSPYGNHHPNTPYRPGPHWGAAPQPPRVSDGDKATSIGLMAVAPVVCLPASFWGAFSVMGTAGCAPDCGLAVEAALPMMIFAPWVIWLVASVWAIVRMIRKKPAKKVMLTGLGVSIVIYVAANLVMFTVLG